MDKILSIVTGASSGIGQAIARSSQQSGAVVATCSRRPIGGANHLSIDLGQPRSWLEFGAWVSGLVAAQSWDRIVLVHSAATITPIGFSGRVDAEDAANGVLLNAASPLLVGDAFLRALAECAPTEQSAVLMQISSGAGKRPFTGWSTYCAAKAGVDMWVRTVGLEQDQLRSNVRVISIGPGIVATDMQADIRNSAQADFPQVEAFRGFHDNGHLADPAEVGSQLWEIALDAGWKSGMVADISDFEDLTRSS